MQHIHIFRTQYYLKWLRGMTSIWGFNMFNFVMKKSIRDHGFIFSKCSDFLKHLLSTFLRIQRKHQQTICTPTGWLSVSTALGHMFMTSAQRCAIGAEG